MKSVVLQYLDIQIQPTNSNCPDDKNDENESEVDLPISSTFTDQAKQREIYQKKINRTIIETRLKAKALRKTRHNVQKQTDVCRSDRGSVQEIQFLPLNKEKPSDSLKEEFDLPGCFNASNHLQFNENNEYNDGKSSLQDNLSLFDIPITCPPTETELLYANESDEGYDGSEKHDKSKPEMILFNNCDFSKSGSNFLKSKRPDSETRDHNSWKKKCRSNGIHVRILDSVNIENTARQRCNSFRQNHLFSPSYSGRYGDVKRIPPSLLKNLSRKKKARPGVH
ncbi:hypothetical protein EWB00_007214 [Schistosoma japonicum]|uniref:Uncharacterized protein n=1 Tax=Schistosoma japonicum TaxID=6182 RepID=A0A4Z2CW35_SCHJA|nr:hypothetical protein EWB00_007214 [Schistosoma japonicum]